VGAAGPKPPPERRGRQVASQQRLTLSWPAREKGDRTTRNPRTPQPGHRRVLDPIEGVGLVEALGIGELSQLGRKNAQRLLPIIVCESLSGLPHGRLRRCAAALLPQLVDQPARLPIGGRAPTEVMRKLGQEFRLGRGNPIALLMCKREVKDIAVGFRQRGSVRRPRECSLDQPRSSRA
jgi:hypothetical protein